MNEDMLRERIEGYEANPNYAGFWKLPWPQGQSTEYKRWWLKERLWYIHQSNLERVAKEIDNSQPGDSPPPTYEEVRDTFYREAEETDIVYLLRQLARGGGEDIEEQLRTLVLVTSEDAVNPQMRVLGLPSQGTAIDVIVERTLPFLLQIRGNTAFADMPGWLLWDWAIAMLTDASQVAEEDVEDQELRLLVASSAITIPDWAKAYEKRGRDDLAQKLHNLTNEEQEALAIATYDSSRQDKAFMLSIVRGKVYSPADLDKLLKRARQKMT